MKRRCLLQSFLWTLFPWTVQAADDAFDLLIVGSGGAGLTAAALLSEKTNLKIAVFEKEPIIGGTSILCGGQWAVAGTDLQKSQNVKDSADLFFEDLMRVGNYKNDPSVVNAFIDASLKQYFWVKKNGVAPKTLALSAGMSRPRAHIFNPREIIALLSRKCLTQGVKIFTSVKVTKILQPEGSTESVCGLEVQNHQGDRLLFRAPRVLLASGGFTRNRTLLKTYASGLDRALLFSAPGSQGDGIEMGVNIGSALSDMTNIKPSFGFIEGATGTKDITGVFYSGAVIVNENAERFINESLPNKEIGIEAVNQKETYLVFDEAIRQKQMNIRPNDKLLLNKVGLFGQPVLQGQSIREIAAKAKLDPEKLETEIRQYNNRIKNGEPDPFGRDSLSQGWGKLPLIHEPPFFITRAYSGLTGTYGGLKIDQKGRVLSVWGPVIKGLYAAGEVTGGVHGEGFMAGTGFGKAMAFGRIVSESIQAEL